MSILGELGFHANKLSIWRTSFHSGSDATATASLIANAENGKFGNLNGDELDERAVTKMTKTSNSRSDPLGSQGKTQAPASAVPDQSRALFMHGLPKTAASCGALHCFNSGAQTLCLVFGRKKHDCLILIKLSLLGTSQCEPLRKYKPLGNGLKVSLAPSQGSVANVASGAEKILRVVPVVVIV